MNFRKYSAGLVLSALASLIAACGSGGDEDSEGAQPGDVYGVTLSNRLVSFSRNSPQVFSSSVALLGLLQPGEEVVVGMDFRPTDGSLHLLTLNLGGTTPGLGRLYRVDLSNGRLTPGPLLSPPDAGVSGCPQGYAGLPANGLFGVDFNPVVDRLRVVTSDGLNLRVDVGSGVTCLDGLIGSDSSVTASAYTNNFNTAANTTLYGIDVESDRLVIQNPPNDGTIVGVGALNTGADVSDAQMDIEGQSSQALAALTINGTAALFQVDLAAGGATLLGTIGTGEPLRAMSIQSVAVAAPTVVAVTTTNRLIGFNAATPGVLLGSAAITGLQLAEDVVGIDFRPATGQLYALGSDSRLYTLNPLTAVATEVGVGSFAPGLTGAAFGFDFNPVPDRIRVVGDDRQNLRLHPDTGAVAGEDTMLSELSMVVGSAYSNNFAGAIQTTLFGIDFDSDMLVQQGDVNGVPDSPNNGVITNIGALGVDTTANVGFDIAGSLNGSALAAMEVGGVSRLYKINLGTGAATLIGPVGGLAAGEHVRGLAILP